MSLSLFSNPIFIFLAGISLFALLFFWNRFNSKNQRNRNKRNFRKEYFDRKREKEKEL